MSTGDAERRLIRRFAVKAGISISEAGELARLLGEIFRKGALEDPRGVELRNFGRVWVKPRKQGWVWFPREQTRKKVLRRARVGWKASKGLLPQRTQQARRK